MGEDVEKLRKEAEKIVKGVPKKSRHIRWHWEKSPDNEEMVRYHFIVVDDKDRAEKITRIISYAINKSIINHVFNPIRKDIEGRVKDSRLKYLFETYESKYPPEFVNPKNIFNNVIQDLALTERNVLSIEDYVERLYEK